MMKLLKLVDRFSFPCYHDRSFVKETKNFKRSTNINKLYNKINSTCCFEGKFKTNILLVLDKRSFTDTKTKRIINFYKVMCERMVFWISANFVEDLC